MGESGASDIFLREGAEPRARVDGVIVSWEAPEVTREMLQEALSQMLRPVQLEMFERGRDLDFGIGVEGGGRFRINAHVQRGLLGMVVRRVPAGSLSFESLGLPGELRAMAELSRGLVLVTGAAGSGKTTTMAAMLHHINSNFPKHIVTIEDPVEFVHENLRSLITQREVGSDTRDFATALRHALRESPDVILIGEMRDLETAQVAVAAAMTGHLVVASLHTIDAVQTLQGLLSFFPEHLREQVKQDLALCLQGVVAQRLVPRADGGGRVVAVEVLSASPAVRKLLRDGRIEEVPELLVSGAGMRSFNQSLLALVQQKTITPEIGVAYSPHPEELRMNVDGIERSARAFFPESDHLPSLGGLDIRALLHSAFRHGASDIHLTAGTPPVFRIHGELRALAAEVLTAGDVRRLLFSVLNHAQREAFELDKELDFALSLVGGTRFRVNAHYQRNTVAVAMRLIPDSLPPLESLGLPDAVVRLAGATQGLLLVSGPTGNGKSTTLATLVDLINKSRSCRIITVEDPIEFLHQNRMANVVQREVGLDTRSFASALKYILRQDPDVIMVGEMRDVETIQAALTAAETGHLVLATLHTNDAPQAVDRIVDVFPPYQQEQVRSQLAAGLLGVVSQRLLRRSDGLGRVAAFEILLATHAVRAMVREGKTHLLVNAMETGFRDGMQTLDRSVEALCRAGRVTRDEALRYVRSPAHFMEEGEAESRASGGQVGPLEA